MTPPGSRYPTVLHIRWATLQGDQTVIHFPNRTPVNYLKIAVPVRIISGRAAVPEQSYFAKRGQRAMGVYNFLAAKTPLSYTSSANTPLDIFNTKYILNVKHIHIIKHIINIKPFIQW